MILTERPRLQPRTLSPINEGQFFLQLDPAARLDPHSAFTIVAIQRPVQRRASVVSILLFIFAKCLPLRHVRLQPDVRRLHFFAFSIKSIMRSRRSRANTESRLPLPVAAP